MRNEIVGVRWGRYKMKFCTRKNIDDIVEKFSNFIDEKNKGRSRKNER
jgi:hypothetical protein